MPPHRKPSADIRVATINLWGTEGDWPRRREVLIEGLRALDADIITLQESIVTSEYDQVYDILSSEYQVLHQERRAPDGTGSSIASRLRLDTLRESFLQVTRRVDPNHGWISNVAGVEVRAPQPVGDMLLVHLKPSWHPDHDPERELQSIVAANFTEELLRNRDLPVVLCGDLDAAPEARSIRFWKGKHTIDGMSARYVDAWEAVHPNEEGHTFTGRNPLVDAGKWPEETGRRIDYIFVKSLEVVDCSLFFDQPIDGVWASDHFGVVADLTATDT